jgi:hypothetical protein
MNIKLFGRDIHVSGTSSKTQTLCIALFLSLTIVSRLLVTYITNTNHIQNPDEYVAFEQKGEDFRYTTNIGVSLLQGKPITNFESNGVMGSGATVVVAGVISILSIIFSLPIEYFSLSLTLYMLLILCTIGLLIKIAWMDSFNTRTQMLICTYLIGVCGTKGLEHGNLDIVFSGIFGVLLLHYLKRTFRTDCQNIIDIVAAITLSIMINTKSILLPIILPFYFRIKNSIVFILIILFLSVIFTSIPIVCCRSSYQENSFLTSINYFGRYISNNATNFQSPPDHSLFQFFKPLLFTFFSFNTTLRTLSVFIVPLVFFGIIFWTIYQGSHKDIPAIKHLKYIVACAKNPLVFLHLTTLAIVAINLLGPRAFDYRTYYSIPILIAYDRFLHNKIHRLLWVVSVGLLLVYGMWFWFLFDSLLNTTISTNLQILLIFHYFALLMLSFVMLPKNKRGQQTHALKIDAGLRPNHAPKN